MTDWIKLVLPLVAVAMTSIIGFFLTDLVGELRTGRTIVHSLAADADTVTVRLANVSRTAIEDVEFVLRCQDPPAAATGETAPPPDRLAGTADETAPSQATRTGPASVTAPPQATPAGTADETARPQATPAAPAGTMPPPACFAPQPGGTWFATSSEGAVPVRGLSETRGNGSRQVGFRVSLLPGARFGLDAATEAGRAGDVYMRWDPAPGNPQPLRLIEAGGIPGFIVLNYLRVLVWAFVAALGVVAIVAGLALLGILLVFLRWLGSLAWVRWILRRIPLVGRIVGPDDPPTAFSRFTMEVDRDALKATFTLAPADPADGGPP